MQNCANSSIIPCNLCGSQENLKRKEVSRMIQEWDKKHQSRSWNVFNALAKIVPSHMIDRNLFDFAGLRPTGVPDMDGDKAPKRNIAIPIMRETPLTQETE
jgi:tRNA 2-thiocytidine biosynthesis protein TtcA